jgi:hypothetical protein
VRKGEQDEREYRGREAWKYVKPSEASVPAWLLRLPVQCSSRLLALAPALHRPLCVTHLRGHGKLEQASSLALGVQGVQDQGGIGVDGALQHHTIERAGNARVSQVLPQLRRLHLGAALRVCSVGQAPHPALQHNLLRREGWRLRAWGARACDLHLSHAGSCNTARERVQVGAVGVREHGFSEVLLSVGSSRAKGCCAREWISPVWTAQTEAGRREGSRATIYARVLQSPTRRRVRRASRVSRGRRLDHQIQLKLRAQICRLANGFDDSSCACRIVEAKYVDHRQVSGYIYADVWRLNVY